MSDPFTFDPALIYTEYKGEWRWKLKYALPDGREVASPPFCTEHEPSWDKVQPFLVRKLREAFEAEIGDAGTSAHKRLAWMAAARAQEVV